MPRMPMPASKQADPVLNLEYYQHLFSYLMHRYSDRLRDAALVEPATFRRAFFRNRFVVGQRLARDPAWDLLFPYLQAVEDQLARVLRRHSAAYWWHIYRRTAPELHPEHSGKTDAV